MSDGYWTKRLELHHAQRPIGGLSGGALRVLCPTAAFLGVLGLLNLWVWWQGQIVSRPAAGVSGAFLVGLSIWIAWVVFAWRSWWRSPEGQLQWDTQAAGDDDQASVGVWRWRSEAYRDGVSLRGVELVLDLQSLALLSLRNRDAASSWILGGTGAQPRALERPAACSEGHALIPSPTPLAVRSPGMFA